MTKVYSLFFVWLLIGIANFTSAQTSWVVNFECFDLPADSFYNGSDFAGDFTINGVTFKNEFDTTGGFESWSGFAVSNTKDTSTPGFTNQYSSVVGSGFAGSDQYAVCFVGYGNKPYITLDENKFEGFSTIWVSNTTYSYLSMRDGDGFTTAFGGASGTVQDSLILVARMYDDGNFVFERRVPLADFRGPSNEDFISKEWVQVMDNVFPTSIDSISFDLEASQSGVPIYFAIDMLGMKEKSAPALDPFNLPQDTFYAGAVDECGFTFRETNSGAVHFANEADTSSFGFFWNGWATSTTRDSLTGGISNQYSPMVSANPSSFQDEILPINGTLIGFSQAEFYFHEKGAGLSGSIAVTNTAYAYYSMLNGDAFAKKFGDTTGGQSGDDYFIVYFDQFDQNGRLTNVDSVVLADFRDPNPSNHFILDDWAIINVPFLPSFTLGKIKLRFASSDTGAFGINTPQYIAMKIAYPFLSTKPITSSITSFRAGVSSSHIHFWIEREHITAQLDFQLYSVDGKPVQTYSHAPAKEGMLTLPKLAPGIYLLQGSTKGEVLGTAQIAIIN